MTSKRPGIGAASDCPPPGGGGVTRAASDAEAKLARVAALIPQWEDLLRGMDGGYADGLGGAIGDLEDALKDPS